MAKIHYTQKYKRIRIRSPNYFDRRSLRVKEVGRKGFTRLIVGCPKGEYNAKNQRCKVGTRTQSILLSRKDFRI